MVSLEQYLKYNYVKRHPGSHSNMHHRFLMSSAIWIIVWNILRLSNIFYCLNFKVIRPTCILPTFQVEYKKLIQYVPFTYLFLVFNSAEQQTHL